jgi:hypothetical protein
MAFNGSGIYVLPVTSVTPAVGSTTIESTDFNTFTNDLETALSLCLTEDGANALTGDLPAGGNKITGLGAGTAATDSATIGGVETFTNKTLTSPKLNEAVAITATATEVNTALDGITSTASELNDLDRGTGLTSWTPVVYGSTTAGSPVGTFTGQYYRIGNLVYATLNIDITDLDTMAGALSISGLPYNQETNFNFALARHAGFTGAATNQLIDGTVQGSKVIKFNKSVFNTASAFTNVLITDLTAIVSIRASFSYVTDDA